MSSNDLPVTDVVGVYASHGQSRAAGASPGDAFNLFRIAQQLLLMLLSLQRRLQRKMQQII
ncbi:Uncharacterised protein [Serratia entomophila]|nr:Uncharacterised protein [Serratia entomophila]CAI1511510.1 Uncharacterised protein [Serratia entomophila]CAI1594013.1 Uncharacterised protein [Serratia entomophila]CAI1825517.1 Uncharacterised protein [Serratia entomophila]CAI1887521.1 Uncharacterised protein [Serratia entomophila]